MNIVWVEQSAPLPAGGHGIDFYPSDRPDDKDAVAVIRGFGWMDSREGQVEILIRTPDSRYSPAFLTTARELIEAYLRTRQVTDGFWARGWLSPDLYVWWNC